MKNKHIILGLGVVAILLIGYALVSGYNQNHYDGSQNTGKDVTFDGVNFKFVDLRGFEHRLSDYKGIPTLVHFMAVGCGGEYSMLNDNQLKQLGIICGRLCEKTQITIFTVLVSTCDETDLSQLYDMYNITWILGNDYQDSKLDVVEKFSEYTPEDGMIVLLDQNLYVQAVFKGAVTVDGLMARIQILEG
jgi:hypothetical protein